MLALAVVFAQHAGTLDLADRTEARARSAPGQTAAADLATTPSARLAGRSRHWDESIRYAPTFTLRELQRGLNPEILQDAGVAVAWHGRRVRLGVSQDGTYGLQNFSYLGPAAATSGAAPAPGTTPIQLLTAPRSVTYGSSRTALRTDLLVTRRLSMFATVGYDLSGGLTADARTVIPFQRGPRAEMEAEQRITLVDSLATHVAASESDFAVGPCLSDVVASKAIGASTGTINPSTPTGTLASCAPQIGIARASERWRRRLSRFSEIGVGAGLSVTRARRDPANAFTVTPYPLGEAHYQRTEGVGGRRTVLRLDAQLLPLVDVRSGTLDYRVQGSAAYSIDIERVVVSSLLGFGQTIDATRIRPATVLRGEVELDYRVTRQLTTGCAVRYVWQTQPPYDALSAVVALAQVTWRVPTMRF